jgi:hypothetical protein
VKGIIVTLKCNVYIIDAGNKGINKREKQLNLILRVFPILVFLFQISYSSIIVNRASNRSLSGFNDVKVIDNYAYCAHEEGLVVLDISNKKKIKLVKRYLSSDPFCDIEIYGGNIVAAAGNSGMLIFDIKNPEEPELISRYGTGDFYNDIYISGNYAFCAASFTGGLQVINITDPRNPQFVSRYKLFDYVNAVAVRDTFVFIISYEYGLSNFTIYPPYIIGPAEFPFGPYDLKMCGCEDIYVDNNLAYIASYACGLFIMDIEDIFNEGILSNINANCNAVRIIVKNNIAFVANDSLGIKILDVKDPSDPEVIADYDTPGTTTGIFVKDNYAYLADGEGGLIILDISDIRKPKHVSTFSFEINK